jgi:hypothetical protein
VTTTDTGARPTRADSGTDDPVVVHGLCTICYPDAKPGDKAVCGHVGRRGIIPKPIDCVVCAALLPGHLAKHMRDGFVRRLWNDH